MLKSWRMPAFLIVSVVTASCIAFFVFTLFTVSAQCPKLQCPSVIDLGEVEIDSVKAVPFEIKNAGNGELVISSILSSCLCTGLEIKKGDSYDKIEKMSIAAGESQQVYVRMKVPKYTEYENSTHVQFVSNDPGNLRCSITVRVKKCLNGISSEPIECLLGHVLSDEMVSKQIILRDKDNRGRRVSRIVVPQSDILKVTLDSSENTHKHADCVGILNITHKGVPANIGTTIAVYFSDGRILEIPVVGRVTSPVEVLPRKPRFIEVNGNMVCKIHCVSYRRNPVTCQASASDSTVKIIYDNGNSDKGSCFVQFEMKVRDSHAAEIPVRIVVNADGHDHEFNVILRKGKS